MVSLVSSPELVGREPELGALRAGLTRATDGGPGIVVVAGEAGIGKTRLIEEFAGRARNDGARVLVGGCLDLADDGLPYAPLTEALRTFLRDLPPDRIASVLGPARDEIGRLLPGIGPIAPAPDGARGLASDARSGLAQASLFGLVLGLLGDLGAEAPTVLVFEDLHWVDRGTRDLVTFLARNLERDRLLLVLTVRTDGLAHGDPVSDVAGRTRARSADRAGSTSTGWTVPRSGRQVATILGSVADDAQVERIHARSGGNPFFVEELVGVERRGGTGPLPRTLSETLAGQIASLPEESQRLLGVVAVAGRPVDERLVAAVSERDEATVREPIRAAVTAGHPRPRSGHGIASAAPLPAGRGARARPLAGRASRDPRTLRRRALRASRAGRPESCRGRGRAGPPLAVRRSADGGVPRLHRGGRGRRGRLRVRGGLPPVRPGHRPRVARAGRRPRRLRPAGPDRASATGGLGGRRRRRQRPGDRLAPRSPRARSTRPSVRTWPGTSTRGSATACGHRTATRRRRPSIARPSGWCPSEPPSAERAHVLVGLAGWLMGAGHYGESRQVAESAIACAVAVGCHRRGGSGAGHPRPGPRLARRAGRGDRRARGGATDRRGARHLRHRDPRAREPRLPADRRRPPRRRGGRGGRAGSRPRDRTVSSDGSGRTSTRSPSTRSSAPDAGPRPRPTRGEPRSPGRRPRHDLSRRGAARLLAGPRRVRASHATCWRPRSGWRSARSTPTSGRSWRSSRPSWPSRRAIPSEPRPRSRPGWAHLDAGDDTVLVGPLCALGLRAAADRAERARALRRPTDIAAAEADGATAQRRAEALWAEHPPTTASGRALQALCAAEAARLAETADAAAWHAVADAWTAIPMPFPAAYARLREAEASLMSGARDDAAATLGQARDTATALGARPLSRCDRRARSPRSPGDRDRRTRVVGDRPRTARWCDGGRGAGHGRPGRGVPSAQRPGPVGPGARGARARRGRSDERPDRQGAVHQPEDRERARDPHPRQARA